MLISSLFFQMLFPAVHSKPIEFSYSTIHVMARSSRLDLEQTCSAGSPCREIFKVLLHSLEGPFLILP